MEDENVQITEAYAQRLIEQVDKLKRSIDNNNFVAAKEEINRLTGYVEALKEKLLY